MASNLQPDDCRDGDLRDTLLNQFLYEIQHAPGLALTPEQASRLFGIPRDVCGKLLSRLVKEGAIYVRPDGRFVRLAPARES